MIKIILAEDHHIVREGLKAMLENQAGFRVLAEAATGGELLTILEKGIDADIVILDLCLPDIPGLELIEIITSKSSKIKVVVLSVVDQESTIAEAFSRGVSGFLSKNVTFQELLFAIDHVSAGNQIISSTLGIKILQNILKRNKEMMPEPHQLDLTPRELEVLNLTAEGYTNNEIADMLFTSKRTIEGHRQMLLTKTGARNTAALIKLGFRYGLLN